MKTSEPSKRKILNAILKITNVISLFEEATMVVKLKGEEGFIEDFIIESKDNLGVDVMDWMEEMLYSLKFSKPVKEELERIGLISELDKNKDKLLKALGMTIIERRGGKKRVWGVPEKKITNKEIERMLKEQDEDEDDDIEYAYGTIEN